jgi:hypothetical protein
VIAAIPASRPEIANAWNLVRATCSPAKRAAISLVPTP